MSSNKKLSDVLNNQFKDEKPFSTFPSFVNSIAIILVFIIAFYGMHIYSSYDRYKLIWPKQKCSPDMTFMAGLFKPKDDPRTAFQYTFDVFKECNKNILYTVVMYFVRPFYALFDVLNDFYRAILELGMALKNAATRVLSVLRKILEDIANKVQNIIIPFKKMFPIIEDSINKGNAFLTVAINSIKGVIMTMESALSVLYTASIDLMIVIAAAGLLFPPLAILWVTFIPISLLAVGLEKIFDLTYLAPIPQNPFCFDENTIISTKNGPVKIKDISIGTILYDNSKITSKLLLNANEKNMYNINNVIVSGSHKIFYQNKWIEVFNHPDAIPIDNYDKPIIYCLNTDNKRIIIDSMIFSDWDDIDDNDIRELNDKYSTSLNTIIKESNIQTHFESGFVKNTPVEIEDGRSVNIQDLQINDVLIDGTIVKGIVEIDATSIDLYEYFIESDKILGGPNLQIYNESTSILDSFELCKVKSLHKEKKLYHVITDTFTIKIKDSKFLDYNGGIETLLIEDRINLLKSI